LAIDDNDLITVSRYELTKPVTTPDDLRKVRQELERSIATIDSTAGRGTEVDIGKYPGYEYDLSLELIDTGKSRYNVFFDGKIEYIINCQSTHDNRKAIDHACDMALHSIQAR